MKIKLLYDLPIDKIHGALKGSIFQVKRVSKELYYFDGVIGQECGAYSREVDILEKAIEKAEANDS